MDEKKKEKIKKRLQVGAGFGFIIVGVPGLFLPILQGVLFIAIGFYLLSLNSTVIEGWISRARKKYPWFNRLYTKVDEFVEVAKNKLFK